MLHTSDRMKQIFTEAPIVAFKRNKNLQDILVHKKHNNLFFSKPNQIVEMVEEDILLVVGSCGCKQFYYFHAVVVVRRHQMQKSDSTIRNTSLPCSTIRRQKTAVFVVIERLQGAGARQCITVKLAPDILVCTRENVSRSITQCANINKITLVVSIERYI